MRNVKLMTQARFAKQGETLAAVALPHTWNAFDGQDGGNDYWRGIGTYEIDLPNPTKGMKQYIEFRGANASADLYVNGEKKIKYASARITNLVLTLEGLQHSSMVIPMSMQGGEKAPSYDGIEPRTCNFLISDPEVTITIPAFNEVTEDGRGAGVPTSISKLGSSNGGYLMLIPQTTGLQGNLYWTELSNFPDTVNTKFSSGIEFKAGRLYQLYINYSGDGITIALIEAGAWDVFDVEHKFE
jgi:hypothetical protein